MACECLWIALGKFPRIQGFQRYTGLFGKALLQSVAFLCLPGSGYCQNGIICGELNSLSASFLGIMGPAAADCTWIVNDNYNPWIRGNHRPAEKRYLINPMKKHCKTKADVLR
jgi:hypothetical protein